MSAKSNGFSQIPHGFAERIAELSGAQLKVWLAHRCREGKKGESYPSLDRLAQDTGLSVVHIKRARKWLRHNGWLKSTGQQRKGHGQFSIPTEHTTIPDNGGNKILAPSPDTAATKGCHGETHDRGNKMLPPCSNKMLPPTSNKMLPPTVVTKSGGGEMLPRSRPKVLSEVDPKVLEENPCEDFKKTQREREVSAAPQAVAPADENPKPSPSLASPAAGSKPAQEETEAERDKRTRQIIDTIIEHAKSYREGKASFSKTARKDIEIALRNIGKVSMNEIDAAIAAEIKQCRDDDPTSYKIFGSTLAANLVAFVRTYRARIAAAKKKIETEETTKQWRLAIDAALAADPNLNLDDWITENFPWDKEFDSDEMLRVEEAAKARQVSLQRVATEPAPLPAVPMEVDPANFEYRFQPGVIRAENEVQAVFLAQETFKNLRISERDILSTSPATRPVKSDGAALATAEQTAGAKS